MSAALLLATSLLSSAQAQVPPALARALEASGAAEAIPVIAVMAEQYDTSALIGAADRLRKADRAAHVRAELQPFAAKSQAALTHLVEELRASGDVTFDEVLWIANARRIHGTPAAIERIAALAGVDRLIFDPELPSEALADVGPEPCEPRMHSAPSAPPAPVPAPAPTAAEPNIVALQAPQLWAAGITGRAALILNIDLGVNPLHPDLAPAIWSNPGETPNGIDDDANGFIDDLWGWDFASGDNQPTDDFHGTNTAGIVCGNGALAGGVATGMAPETNMAVARVAGQQGQMIAAYQYAITIGATCVTSSLSLKWTAVPDYHLFRTACDAELAAGIVHANSIGNQGQMTVFFPVPYNIATPGNCPGPWRHPSDVVGGLSSVLGCGGLLMPNDDLYLDSGVGPAAWEDIQFTNPGYVWPQLPGYWDYPHFAGAQPGLLKPDLMAYTSVKTTLSSSLYVPAFAGTSAATPHLGGALCLMVDANPAVPPRQISQALQQTALDLGAPGKDNVFGAGKIRVYDAALRVRAAVTAYPVDPPLGSTVVLELTGPSGDPYQLGLSLSQAVVPTPLGISLGIGLPIVVVSSGLLTGYSSPVSLAIPVPSDPIFTNLSVYLQLVTDDTAGTTGKWLVSLVERVKIH